jgi:hypothetical protein
MDELNMAAIIRVQRQASSREGKRRLHHIEVHPAKNGGHTVEHHYTQDDGLTYREPDVYAFQNAKETLKHLAGELAGGREPLSEEVSATPQAKPEEEESA